MYGLLKEEEEGTVRLVRDLEGYAKRLKVKIETNRTFIGALEQFVHRDGLYQIEDYADRKTLFAIYGDLKMRQPGIEKRYNHLLELMEKEGE